MPTHDLAKILADCSPAVELLSSVSEFYGSSFNVSIRATSDGVSHFSIDPGQEDLLFKSASITVNPTGNRVKEAVVHELLHLNLPIIGFNPVHTLSLADRYAVEFPRIDETIKKTVNVVQHTIFLEQFIEMGLPIDRFLAAAQTEPQYGAEARQYLGAQLDEDRAWIAWSWWSLEFLRNYLAIQHGDKKAKSFARSAAKWGDRLLPGFKRKTNDISDWFEKSDHKHPAKYQNAMNSLFTLMEIPATVRYCALKASPNGRPSVVPEQ
jgi:hypothetical protein